MRPNVIVSGYMRTGTSMMVGSLIDGGYEAVYDGARYSMLSRVVDDEFYHLNPREIFEFDPSEWNNREFPSQYPGTALKVRYTDINKLATMENGFHFIQMRRDPEEVRQSVEAAFAPKKAEPWLSVSGEYTRRMDCSLGWAQDRDDLLSTTVVDYPLTDPLETFGGLADSGIDIDPHKAAANYDDGLYHFRLSELVVGI